MAVCTLRTLLLIVCILELIVTVQRQIFDFLGYMWLPIIANFVNILLIIFGSFGAVQYITRYLVAYAIWSLMWLAWNIFLVCYYLNLGSLNRESGLLSLGTGSISWWEGNGWGCRAEWSGGEAGAGAGAGADGAWRPTRVAGCLLAWHTVELAQAAAAALLAALALPLVTLLTFRSFNRRKPTSDKGTLPRRRPVYTIELSPAEPAAVESSLKPMTPRRVKRRSGSRGAGGGSGGGSARRSRRSYRNAAYAASSGSLHARPASAHSSYSNFHEARPASYHAPPAPLAARDPPPTSVPIKINRYEPPAPYSPTATSRSFGGYEPGPPEPPSPAYDNIAPYDATLYEQRAGAACEAPGCGHSGGGEGAGGECWEGGYSARATPQAPGPPAYHQVADHYNLVP